MGTFEALAFDVAAALVLCGLNALVSTPDDSIIKRIHLEIHRIHKWRPRGTTWFRMLENEAW